MKFQHPLFSREEPTSLYHDLQSLPQLVKIAVYGALASGPAEDVVERLDLAEVQRIALVAVGHLKAARERAVNRENAADKAIGDAERRVKTALAGVVCQQLDEAFNPHGFFVYCLWGNDVDRPLYVGLSTNILARLGSHLSDKEKRYRVQRITLIRCKTHGQMVKTEIRLIDQYQPPLNTIGVRDWEASA